MKVFSVLISNFNNAKYLNDCLNSVINQTYENIEIVIVDDCSSDGSDVIINKFIRNNDKYNIIYERNDINKGCGYSKARCAELSTGDICGFLDSDDELVSNAVETMVKYHENNLDCGLISSRYYVCNQKLTIQYPSKIINSNNFKNYLLSPRLTHFNTFKKDFYGKTKGIDPIITHGVDQDLCLKLEEVGNILFVPEVLYCYRTYRESISHGNGAQKATFYNLVIRIEACKRRDIPISAIMNIYRFRILSYPRILTSIITYIRKIEYIIRKKDSKRNVYKIVK